MGIPNKNLLRSLAIFEGLTSFLYEAKKRFPDVEISYDTHGQDIIIKAQTKERTDEVEKWIGEVLP